MPLLGGKDFFDALTCDFAAMVAAPRTTSQGAFGNPKTRDFQF
jgi:hypothetical protein